MTDFNTDRDVNRAIRSWLREDRHEDVSRVAGAVLDQVEAIPQRRATWWPARRVQIVSKTLGYGLAAATAVAVLIVGVQLAGGVGVGAGSSPTPPAATLAPATPAPATPAPAATPGPTRPAPTAPPLTQTFTSTLHGFSVSYPEGWVARPATEPYVDRPGVPQVLDPGMDLLSDPTQDDHLFIWLFSTPIGDSTPDEWVAKATSAERCSATEPIVVDGARGLFLYECVAVVGVTTAGRGYVIGLYTPTVGEGRAFAGPPYDRAWFEAFLATVQLHPEDAVN